MPIITTVGYFELRGYGWAEAWSRDTQTTNLLTIRDEVEPMWLKRVALLGRQAVFQSYRVSREDIKQDAILTYKNLPGPGNWDCASPQLALVARFYNALRTRRKDVFLRGFDDRISELGGVIVKPDATTAFWQAFSNWGNFISAAAENTNPYGWHTRTVVGGMPSTILSYETDPEGSGRVNFTCTAATFPLDQVNTYQKVGISKLGADGVSILNGDQTVYVLSQTVCQTTKAIATFPWSGSLGQIKRYNFAFTPAVAPVIDQKIGRRGAGKISHVTPGRAKERPKG